VPIVQRDLGDGLLLCSGEKTDIPAIIEHVVTVHGKGVKAGIQRWFDYHPTYPLRDSFLVKDSTTGKVVSYLGLARYRCNFEGTEIPYGQMEIVGTLPEYRNKGLIRYLNEAFEQRAAEYGLPFLVIAGIPYFYRQFGYEYAISFLRTLQLSTETIGALKSGEKEPVRIQKVTKSIFPQFLTCREQSNQYLDLYRVMSPKDFDYTAKGGLDGELGIEYYLVKKGKKAVGSFFISTEWGRLEIHDLWLADLTHLHSVLRWAKIKAQKRNLPLNVSYPSRPGLVEVLERTFRSSFTKGYAWYVRIPSVKFYLQTIRPVLEQRLAKSDLCGYSGILQISCFRIGYEFKFKQGKLVTVNHLDQTKLQERKLAIPPLVINQLLLGYCTLAELMANYPDVLVEASAIPLINVLFPKIRAKLTPEF
jgi:predicted N-acetyltransferase YhbS